MKWERDCQTFEIASVLFELTLRPTDAIVAITRGHKFGPIVSVRFEFVAQRRQYY